MFEILYSLLAGVVQGLTEFLPVSSSGHLVLLHDFLNFDFADNIAFDVVLHWGTLFALLFFFKKDVFQYLKAFFKSFKKWNLRQDDKQRIAWYLLIATIPAAVVGYFLEDQIETLLRGSELVAWMLIIFGILLYVVDKYASKQQSMESLKAPGAILIGFAQALALIPGVSRSGITIITGLSQKLHREAAARFSFLLSMPIVFGAGLKKLIDLFSEQIILKDEIVVLLVGFFSSMIVGYLCIKFFLKFLQNHSLKVFAYYRVILGIIILI